MTKNLKLAIAALAIVSSMNVNAQKKSTVTTKVKKEVKAAQSTSENEAGKPTKQETMDWIGGKMKENLAGTVGDFRHFVSYNNGVFVYKKEAKMDEWYFTTIDLNNVKGMNNSYSKDFYVTGKKLVNTLKEGNTYGTDDDFLSISGPNYNDYPSPFNFTADQALVDRVKKAFTTLIEYNSTQKGADEKF